MQSPTACYMLVDIPSLTTWRLFPSVPLNPLSKATLFERWGTATQWSPALETSTSLHEETTCPTWLVPHRGRREQSRGAAARNSRTKETTWQTKPTRSPHRPESDWFIRPPGRRMIPNWIRNPTWWTRCCGRWTPAGRCRRRWGRGWWRARWWWWLWRRFLAPWLRRFWAG